MPEKQFYVYIDPNGPHKLRRAGWKGELGCWLSSKGFRRLGTWIGFVEIAPEAIEALKQGDKLTWYYSGEDGDYSGEIDATPTPSTTVTVTTTDD